MDRLIVWGVVSLAAVGIVTGAYYKGAVDGAAECKAEQVEADRKAYAEIIEKIQDEGISLDDPASVDCLLSELAGEPTGTECGGL